MLANAFLPQSHSHGMGTPNSVHVPVLLDEIIDGLPSPTSPVIIDGTLGGGGHSRAFIERFPLGRIIAVDRDPEAVGSTRCVLEADFPDAFREHRFSCHASSYAAIPQVMLELGIVAVDAILLDLGLSSDQLASEDRGFSFKTQGDLDLRFNRDEGISARELLAKIKEAELADLIYRYGEERFSRRIARVIVESRKSQPIQTADQLHRLIHRVVPGRIHGRVDASTRTFQALRIAVNRELEHLEQALQVLPDCLRPGGRLLIISFHSLEDRLVKNAFRDDPRLMRLTKKPIISSEHECSANPRSRSAKLRIAERLS
jgi:16S rRNA (cytosine1402-N4)-methyltransferase